MNVKLPEIFLLLCDFRLKNLCNFAGSSFLKMSVGITPVIRTAIAISTG